MQFTSKGQLIPNKTKMLQRDQATPYQIEKNLN